MEGTASVNRSGESRPQSPRRELGIYLNDHLAGATAGADLARRLASSQTGTPLHGPLQRLADEVAEDRAALLETMTHLGFPPRAYKKGAGRLAEKLGRLKLNGHLLRRSPLSTLLELEMLRLGVEGKRAAWRSLLEVADSLPDVDVPRLEGLEERARQQTTVLEALRVREAARVLPG